MAGEVDRCSPAPAYGRVEEGLGLDHRIVAVDDPFAAEALPEPRMVRDVIAVREEHAAHAATSSRCGGSAGREAR